MRIRREYQTACPVCRAHIGAPCTGKHGERLPGIHFQRGHALRSATRAALHALYAPLTPQSAFAPAPER